MHCPGDVFTFFFFCSSLYIAGCLCLWSWERERERASFLYVCASQCVTVDFEEFAHASDQMSRDVASVFKLRPVLLL